MIATSASSGSSRGRTASDAGSERSGSPPELKEVFSRFATLGKNDDATLDSLRFSKLCGDCELELHPAVVDLVFTKAKDKGQRKINFRQFRLRALPDISERTGIPYNALVQHIVALQGPRVGIATRPTDAGVFGQLTDERQQTGVYGSKFCQKPVKRSQGPLMQSSTSSSLPKVPHEYHHDLRLAFEEFAAYGTGFASQSEMNNVNFAKICQDCGLVDNRLLPKHEVDLIFAKVKQRGTRAITFKQFADLAVPLLATARRVTIEELCQAMIHARPMTFATCTRVDTGTFRRLTDENHYTGVHAEKFGRQPSKREQEPKLEAVPKDLVEGLSAAFREFCWYGASGPQQAQMGDDLSMDNARFAKLIRDAGLMQKTCLNPGAVDVVFTKSVAKGSRRINVAAFVGRALPLLALESGLPVKDIANAVGRTRPLSVATVTRTSGGLYQKLTDPSQYTGMYAERSGRDLYQEYIHGGRELIDSLSKQPLSAVPSIFEGSLRKAFRRFGGRADGLTEPGFYRLVRDARLRTQKLTSEQIGAIFDACKEKYTDMLLFETFFAKAVPLLASAADVDVQKTAKRLVDAEPRTSHGSHGTSGYTSVFDKLTDVNSYTGMYRERFTSPNTSAAVLGSRRNSAPMDTYASYFETDNPA